MPRYVLQLPKGEASGGTKGSDGHGYDVILLVNSMGVDILYMG
jgi:hypothetical protein